MSNAKLTVGIYHNQFVVVGKLLASLLASLLAICNTCLVEFIKETTKCKKMSGQLTT